MNSCQDSPSGLQGPYIPWITATVQCAELPPGIQEDNTGLFLKDLFMYPGSYKMLDNYYQEVLVQGLQGCSGSSFDEGPE